MTASEIKSEIQKSLDKVPESVLNQVLSFLKKAENQSEDKLKLAQNLRQILEEDNNLLERLAK